MVKDQESNPSELATVDIDPAFADRDPCGTRPMPLRRAFVCFGIALGVTAAILLVSYAVHPHPLHIHAEWGLIENAQILCWFVVMVLGLLMLRRKGHPRDRLNGFWLSVLAYMAMFRELDTHELFNSEVLGIWAISYKPSWVMDAQVPLYVKAAWAVLILGGMACVLVPLIFIRSPVMKLLNRNDAPTVFFILGVGLIFIGYLADDVFGRELIFSVQSMQAIEELLELVGYLSLVWSTVLTYRWPLTVRERWLGLDRSPAITNPLPVCVKPPRVRPDADTL